MPDGVTHFEVGMIGGVIAVTATAAYVPELLRPVVIGTIAGLIITPDLDQDGQTFTEALLRRIPLLGPLFQWSWYPYATAFRHRGWSHHIIVGTPSRVLWAVFLALFWATVAIGVGWLWDGAPRDWVSEVVEPVLREAHPAVLVAWWWQDALHVLADML